MQFSGKSSQATVEESVASSAALPSDVPDSRHGWRREPVRLIIAQLDLISRNLFSRVRTEMHFDGLAFRSREVEFLKSIGELAWSFSIEGLIRQCVSMSGLLSGPSTPPSPDHCRIHGIPGRSQPIRLDPLGASSLRLDEGQIGPDLSRVAGIVGNMGLRFDLHRAPVE